MSLTAAIRTAQSALHTTSAQTAITSRNIAGASDPGYSRKLAVVTTAPNGGTQMLAIKRAFDKSLFDNMIAATSRASGQQALVDGLNALEVTIGDPEHDRSPAALVGALNDALQLYSTTPNDLSLAQSAVNRANDLARALNEASDAVQGVRRQADKDMAAAVDQLNSLLADFQSVNGEIVVRHACRRRCHRQARPARQAGLADLGDHRRHHGDARRQRRRALHRQRRRHCSRRWRAR